VAAAIALTVVTGSVMAFGVSHHENKLTFSRPVALPDVVLPAGTYSFDVTGMPADLVVVRNVSHTKVFYTGFTNAVIRPNGTTLDRSVVFGEAPQNQPPPITTWYEIGRVTGHEFLY
jgi:hypothetical protein